MEGEGFSDASWQELNEWDRPAGNREYFGLIRPGVEDDCELVVEDEYVSSTVDSAGHLEASFRVGSSGGCFQTDRREPVEPGVYQVQLRCHPCFVGTFRVTE